MNGKAVSALAGLGLLGAFIWLRDIHGGQGAADTLPLLAAFPLYLALTYPWNWRPQASCRPPASAFAGLGLVAAGVVADSNLVLAAGWVALFDAFQSCFLERPPRRYLILLLLGFPWVTENLQSLGWTFRYTGAEAVQALFTLLGVTVHRAGTLLYIRDLPLSIEPACAGLNVLQSTLIVGSLLICLRLRGGWPFWAALVSLIPLAWMANTIRIFLLGCAGLWIGPDFANGWFHKWGGWLVLCFMFVLCESLFSLFLGRSAEKRHEQKNPA